MTTSTTRELAVTEQVRLKPPRVQLLQLEQWREPRLRNFDTIPNPSSAIVSWIQIAKYSQIAALVDPILLLQEMSSNERRRVSTTQRFYFTLMLKFKGWSESRTVNSELYGYPHLLHDKKRPPKAERHVHEMARRSRKKKRSEPLSHATNLTL